MSEHELWNELGNLYFMSGTYRQAAYAYNRSIQLDAGFGRPYCNLALTYVKQGRYEEAVQLYQRSIELLADQAEKAITWYRLGDVYRHLKNYRDAILAYQQADILEPELSQESKESDEILYGGSGENLPANSPEMQACALETEAALQTDEAPVEIASENVTVTETPILQVSPLLSNVTATALLNEPAAPAAVTGTRPLEMEASIEELTTETVAVLEIAGPLNEEIEAPEAVELADEDEAEIDEVPVTELVDAALEAAQPEAEPISEICEAIETLEAETTPVEEPRIINLDETQPVTAIFDAGESTKPDLRIEIVFDREVVIPLEAIQEAAAAEMECRTETVSMPELAETATETLSLLESPPPAAETLSNATDPAAAWIDDDYLVSNFEQETEVYLPDFEEDELKNWLPLEHEPAYSSAGPEDSWSGENRMQLAVQAPVQNARRLPGHMLRESWEPALPLEDDGLDLSLVDENMEDVFIVPMEAAEAEAAAEMTGPEAAPCLDCEPDPLQTAEEMEQIEKEITRFKYVVQSNPKNAAAWDTLGTFYKSARKYREAIQAYQQAVAVDPTKAHYHHHLGILYSIMGREEDAMKAFQDVIEIAPDHNLANATLGGYYRKMGLEELAQKHIGRAMKNFYNSENEYNKACLEALCGNVEQSIELLKIALKNKQTYVDWVLRDPDLDSIRRDPRFKQLIADYMA